MMDMVTQERSLTRAELLQKIVEYTDWVDEMMKLPNGNKFLIDVFSLWYYLWHNLLFLLCSMVKYVLWIFS
jgi:hypothetical protein